MIADDPIVGCQVTGTEKIETKAMKLWCPIGLVGMDVDMR